MQISRWYLLPILFIPGCITEANGAAILYGSSDGVDLFTIDLATGKGTRVASLPAPATEIEFDNLTGQAYLQHIDGEFLLQRFDIQTGAAIGAPIADLGSYNGLEFVGSTLFGAAITTSGGRSNLRILNPTTGASTLIGSTRVGPIAGLAYNEGSGVMYGIAGGPGPASFYSINLSTGAATLVGSTGIQAGSLEFGPDGLLYAGGTGSANGGSLYRINPVTGASTLIGATGFAAVTGLTLVNPIPEPTTTWLIGLGLMALSVYKRMLPKVRQDAKLRAGSWLASHIGRPLRMRP